MFANGIKETTTTSGTGTLTLSSVTGYARFSTLPTGTIVSYAIKTASDDWEWGLGTIAASNTLERSQVNSTLVSGTYTSTGASALSLSGTSEVICTAAAESFIGSAKNVNQNASLNTQKLITSQHILTNNASSTGFSAVADQLYLVPFWLVASATIDALAVRVGTGAAAKSVRMGIYDIDQNGHPATLLAETGVLSAATSSTDVIGTFSGIRINAGWYFVALVSDGTPALGRLSAGGHLPGFLGVDPTNMLVDVIGIRVSHTFGALPNPAPTTALTRLNAGAALPAIMMRVA